MSIRFAPSPTGTFHLGNLRTAWISHEFARALKLPWIVRFEDIDQPRVLAGAMEKQLVDMKALGLVPDHTSVQSEHYSRHEAFFRKAIQEGKVYPCSCSRKEILESLHHMASAPHGVADDGAIYNGRCRDPKNRKPSSHPTLAWRFLNSDDSEGKQDFIVDRTNQQNGEFVPSYHWACAIDDYDGNHALLVRASDLAPVITQQSLIHRWVGESESRLRPYPAVFHTSLIVSNDGHRLEKRTRGVTLDEILQMGISRDEILERFKKSLNPALFREFSPGKIWSEPFSQMSLKTLGF